VLPRDYTLVMSRIALIPTTISHPELARLFLDFLLSKQGQRIVAETSHLYSIHPEVTGKTTAEALRSLAAGSLRPIPLGPGLLVYLDQVKRQKFLKRWERVLGGR
jgi:iron(III) transport system substrate-binding protein